MSQLAQAQSNAALPPISGFWISSARSQLQLSVSSTGNLTGLLARETGPSQFQRATISGYVSMPGTDGNYPISFVACWLQSMQYYADVTSYTGMYVSAENNIPTVFLLVDPTKPFFAAVSVGTDLFSRSFARGETSSDMTLEEFAKAFDFPPAALEAMKS